MCTRVLLFDFDFHRSRQRIQKLDFSFIFWKVKLSWMILQLNIKVEGNLEVYGYTVRYTGIV